MAVADLLKDTRLVSTSKDANLRGLTSDFVLRRVRVLVRLNPADADPCAPRRHHPDRDGGAGQCHRDRDSRRCLPPATPSRARRHGHGPPVAQSRDPAQARHPAAAARPEGSPREPPPAGPRDRLPGRRRGQHARGGARRRSAAPDVSIAGCGWWNAWSTTWAAPARGRGTFADRRAPRRAVARWLRAPLRLPARADLAFPRHAARVKASVHPADAGVAHSPGSVALGTRISANAAAAAAWTPQGPYELDFVAGAGVNAVTAIQRTVRAVDRTSWRANLMILRSHRSTRCISRRWSSR